MVGPANQALGQIMTSAHLTKGDYWAKRIQRHLILSGTAIAVTWLAYAATPPPDVRHRLSMATAYASLLFLALCLALGPWNVLNRLPNPVSFDLRRDIGIWAGILALVHTAIGLSVHLRGRMWMYFFKRLHPLRVQNTRFGVANYLGLSAALLFVMLLMSSNDYSLRVLKTKRWKTLQRWNYVASALTIVHGLLYQLVEKRLMPWVVLYWTVIAAICGFQSAAIMRRRGLSDGRLIEMKDIGAAGPDAGVRE